MPTFRFPLPPSGSNHTTQVGRYGQVYRTAESLAWEAGVRLIVGGWTPPARMPLQAHVRLEIPRPSLWRRGLDKWCACVLDAVLGVHADEWVAVETFEKVAGDGWAEVTVEEV